MSSDRLNSQPRDADERSRMSGPGLRAFVKICDLYALTLDERVAVLGAPDQDTYTAWVEAAEARDALCLSEEALYRMSAVLGIYKNLHQVFQQDAHATAWLKGPNSAELFSGRAPLDLMVQDGLDGVLTVRYFLDETCERLQGMAWGGAGPSW